jgi:hypothetical protein
VPYWPCDSILVALGIGFDAIEIDDGVRKKAIGAPAASNRERPGIIRDFRIAGKALRGIPN